MFVARRTPPVGDGVGQVLAGALAGRRDAPHPVGDEAHPLRGGAVERGVESGADLGLLRAEAVGVQRLGARGHLGVVEPKFLLKAHEAEQSARDPHERVHVVFARGPATVGDGVELVLQADD